MIRALAIAAVLAVAAPASANVWKHASDPIGATADEVYARALATGDDLALQASAQSTISLRTIHSDIQLALTAYRTAAAAEPERAEPYFRIGDMLYELYFSWCGSTPSVTCDNTPGAFNPVVAQQIIDAWDAAEARAPLDPRFGFTQSNEPRIFRLLFERGVLNTKFADPAHLEAAGRDYRTVIARSGGVLDDTVTTTINNLAETYMMLGKLDEAIELYRDAVHRQGDFSVVYGFAVALDRDGNGDEARAVIAKLGPKGYEEFRKYLHEGAIFFVPAGEAFYYLALAEEAVGNPGDATKYWDHYIESGAHPQFQLRAKAHVAALSGQLGPNQPRANSRN